MTRHTLGRITTDASGWLYNDGVPLGQIQWNHVIAARLNSHDALLAAAKAGQQAFENCYESLHGTPEMHIAMIQLQNAIAQAEPKEGA